MSVLTDDGRTSRWETGEPITHRDAGITGFARWTFPRKKDNKRFLRVQITSGPRQGVEDWENGRWIVGQGTHQLTCRDCGYRFRTNQLDDLWCPPCYRLQQPRHDTTATSRAHHRQQLRGNAAREHVDRDDEFETPF